LINHGNGINDNGPLQPWWCALCHLSLGEKLHVRVLTGCCECGARPGTHKHGHRLLVIVTSSHSRKSRRQDTWWCNDARIAAASERE
jgi:hypothetical protein